MSALWNAEQAARATGGDNQSEDWVATGISIDTRTLNRGDLFVALQGPHHDGHDYLDHAFKAGASAAMVHKQSAAAGPCLRVDDTLEGLNGLARWRRRELDAKVIGITGSVGKTGTKEICRRLLGAQASVHASAASYNNHWGVPLTLARTPIDADYLLVEMGMSAPGEIAALTALTRPHVALITQVAPAHLAFFDSVASIAHAKAEIIEGIEQGGIAVLPADNEHIDILISKAASLGVACVTFGTAPSADWRITALTAGAGSSDVEVRTKDQLLAFHVGAPGEHWTRNAVGALAALEAAGADAAQAARHLEDIELAAGRGRHEVLEIADKQITLIDESYNANPASMRAALNILGRLPNRKIAVLGDMLELGRQAPEMHTSLVDAVLSAGIAQALFVGPNMAHLRDAVGARLRCRHVAASSDALAALRPMLEDGDAVLVKGSNGIQMSQIVAVLRQQAQDNAALGGDIFNNAV